MPARRSLPFVISLITLMVIGGLSLSHGTVFGYLVVPIDEPPTPGGEAPGPGAVTAKYGSTIYQGVAAITTGDAGASMLEIGNGGQDIASTGSIYLRPLGMAAASSIRFDKTVGGSTRLHAPGGVCFGSSSCQDTWPTGSGTSFWDVIASHYLQPKPGYGAMNFAKTDGTHPAIEVNANTTDAALAITSVPASGVAANFAAGFNVENDVSVDARPATGDEILAVDQGTGTMYRVWHAGNDGHTAAGNGLDASKLDGTSVSFRTVPQAQAFYARCGKTGGPVNPDQNCFCGDFSGLLGNGMGTEIRCVRLQQ